jgi:dihydrofolate reductase
MGAATYAVMAAHWPSAPGPFAKPMNEIPKVVFSRTLAEATWPESSIARGDLAEEIGALRAQPGGEMIAWGGATFAQALSRAGLVDEYVLVINPVALGSGLPMFADLPAALRLELVEARVFGSTALHIYRPGRHAG